MHGDLRTPPEDAELTGLLREWDRITARIRALGVKIPPRPGAVTMAEWVAATGLPPRPVVLPRWVCPECGGTSIGHERGLLFCERCGHTWPADPGTDREDL